MAIFTSSRKIWSIPGALRPKEAHLPPGQPEITEQTQEEAPTLRSEGREQRHENPRSRTAPETTKQKPRRAEHQDDAKSSKRSDHLMDPQRFQAKPGALAARNPNDTEELHRNPRGQPEDARSQNWTRFSLRSGKEHGSPRTARLSASGETR
jgi:hypothetical protein